MKELTGTSFNKETLYVGDYVYHVIARRMRESIIEKIEEDNIIKMKGIKTLIKGENCIKINYQIFNPKT